MISWLALSTAGGVGAVCRFLLDGAVQTRHKLGLPIGTLVINILGSFLLGALNGWVTRGGSAQIVWILGTGFCGGFTTFSTASVECFRLLTTRQRRVGLGYASLTLIGAITAAFLGLRLVSW